MKLKKLESTDNNPLNPSFCSGKIIFINKKLFHLHKTRVNSVLEYIIELK